MSTDNIIHLACGNWHTQMLAIVCKLGIPDIIGDPATMAKDTGTNENALYRMLRALSTLGIFREDSEGIFHHTNDSLLLTKGHPSCMRDYCIMRGSYYQYQSWYLLMDTIQTGKSAMGIPMFEYLRDNPEESKHFHAAMSSISRMLAKEIGEHHKYLFTGVDKVVDIGGGQGDLLSGIVDRVPHIDGTVIDLVRGPYDNVTYHKGSFFKPITVPANMYMMKYILHDWGDEDCIRILRNIKGNGATLAIIEGIIIPDGNDYHKMLDMMMLTCLADGARERTLPEYEYLLGEAGYHVSKVIQLDTLGLSIILANE